MKNAILLILIALAFQSCQSENKSTDDVQMKAKFMFDNSLDEYENPKAIIYIEFIGKKTKIETVSGRASLIDRQQFDDFEIPQDAVEACQSFWAGAGDYFYLLQNGETIEVYAGWQDEGQDDEGFHWEKRMNLK